LIEGHFDHTLDDLLSQIQQLDFIFLDGNHRYEPTVAYFEKLLSKAHEGTVWVIDDIHWSEEMKQAWAYIKDHPSIRASIDLYWSGIAFQRSDIKHKAHLRLVPYRWKPWLIGLW
jgi:predicted O-methyltransferase YrrM